MPEYISLKMLADELGMHRSSLRRYVVKRGFSHTFRRMPDSGNQKAMAFSLEVAEAIISERNGDGFVAMPENHKDNSGIGFFYVIRVVPELAPNRIKLGYAANVGIRLQAHRTIAPTVELVQSWPCKSGWEQVVIESVTREGCVLIGGEVFECDDIAELVKRCERFFEMMPSF
jgi:hypothetical protein